MITLMITVMITGAVADEPGAAPPGGRPPSSEPIGVRNLTSPPKGAFRATREPLRTPPSRAKCGIPAADRFATGNPSLH
jgi:hypothetical protein